MKKFRSKKSVTNCLENHSAEKHEYILCSWTGCKASLKSPQVLKEHVRRTHTDPKERVKCQICSKDYADKSDLRRHTKFVHEKPEKKFECNICGTRFFTEKLLERHMQTHEGKSFPCWYPECLTKRSTMYDLRHHYKKEHDEVRHKKDFIPIEERPDLTCEICGKNVKAGASPNTSLKHHMERHKNHSLDFCKVDSCNEKLFYSWPSYTLPASVYHHLQTVHHKNANQIKILYKCKKCEKEIIFVQRGVKKQLEQWSRALIVHIMSHDWEGMDKTQESESEMFMKLQAGLLNNGWRKMYIRKFGVLKEKAAIHDTLDKRNIFIPHEDENVKSRKLTEEECQKAFLDITKKIPVIFLKKVFTV